MYKVITQFCVSLSQMANMFLLLVNLHDLHGARACSGKEVRVGQVAVYP